MKFNNNNNSSCLVEMKMTMDTGLSTTVNNNNNNNQITGCGLIKIEKEVCFGCSRSIEDRYLLKVMGNSWHEHCLQCDVCKIPLSRSCYAKDAKLYCKSDYEKLFGTKCFVCQMSIPSNELVMRALGNVYHLHCFTCIMCCQRLQKGDEFVVKDGHLYCKMDFEKELIGVMQNGDDDDQIPLSDDKEQDCPQSLVSLDGKDSPSSSSIQESGQIQSSGRSGKTNADGKPCRKRIILTTQQRRIFKAAFEVSSKPCRKVRESLAAETGLSVRVVQVWFQNQRAKVKKLARRQQQEQEAAAQAATIPGTGRGRNGRGQRSNDRGMKDRDSDCIDMMDFEQMKHPDALHPPLLSEMMRADGHYPPQIPMEGQFPPPLLPPPMQESMLYPNSIAMSQSDFNEMFSRNGSPMVDNMSHDGLTFTMQGNHSPPISSCPPIGPPNSLGQLNNPIDKLYDMQSSYFNAE